MSVERERDDSMAAATHGPATAAAPASAEPAQFNADRTASHQSPADPGVVVVALPRGAPAPKTSAAVPTRSRQPAIHVATNLRELVVATPGAGALTSERRDLNEVVHGVLIIGLAISTALMLAGVGLALFYGRELPTTAPDVGEVFSRVLALRPSGFVALGLLMLIATPILRVVGSIGAFLYERDWRFAAITSVVLGILMISLLLGRG